MHYHPAVIEHFESPRNLYDPGAGQRVDLTGAGGERRTGLRIEFHLAMDGETISAAWFRAYGCPHALALGSWLTEYLPGRPLREVTTLDRETVTAALDLPVEKTNIVLVAEDALRACAAQLA